MNKLIDADKLIRKAQRVAVEAWKMKMTASIETILNQFIDWIKEAPAIDAVEVVRCKDCLYKDMDICAMYRLAVAGLRRYDDFCSYGVRKGDRP